MMEKAGNGGGKEGNAAARKTAELDSEAAIYKQALERAREEMQSFAYSVSHDLRAPLRAIEGFSRILLEDFSRDLKPEAQTFLQHIVTNTQHLGGQIEDLLKLYRSTKNPPIKINVDADSICSESIAMLQGGKRSNVDFQKDPLPKVLADPVQLRLIFSEILSNSIKATAGTANPRVEITAKTEPGAATFSIRDNGKGFDEKNAGKLFQVFQKVHTAADFPGNGVGLAIVKRLVEGQGGCVSAQARPGEGALFRFSLPTA